MFEIGAHTPSKDPVGEARLRGADVVQIFVSNARSWKPPVERADAAELRAAGIPIFVHTPYLINVVSDDPEVRAKSRRSLQQTCQASAAIGALGVVVHGGHVTGDGTMDDAFPRWREALESVESDVPVLIENTAGGDKAPARRIEMLDRLWESVGDLGPGFVLDTCHAWAGGEPVEGVAERIKAVTGRIDLVHCNDSKDAFDSRRDRHENLGQGEIPAELIVEMVRQAGAPVVVETPGGVEEQAADIEWLRSRLG